MNNLNLQQKSDFLWEIPRQGKMQVPAYIYATAEMMEALQDEQALQQAANVAEMPGIVKASLAMPDIHRGYGFPIGGVAAFDPEVGVISPGGVGYDINCGVRLMASDLHVDDIKPRLRNLVDCLFGTVPTGVGASGRVKLTLAEEKQVATEGARWAVDHGYGQWDELEFIEENGCIDGADPDAVSYRAWERGSNQLGTLGSGNHFLEVDYVAEIYDEQAAETLGLRIGQVCVIIHSGSRGFGYQICDDFVGKMNHAMTRHDIELPDKQLCCAPIDSSAGREYLGAMRCAINYAFANRQVMASFTRQAFERALDASPRQVGLKTVYEVAHNIAKFERHEVDGEQREVCVHRKGATRAFGPGHPEIPAAYREVGQPVLIPGDMERYSYVLVGTGEAMKQTFGSCCHGAGRALSRRQAKKSASKRHIDKELQERGIIVQASSKRTLQEEIQEAYKDVTDVVDCCEKAGISRTVAQLRPMGCIKG